MKSIDGAATWNHVSTLNTDRREIYFVNKDLILALGAGFSRSIDGGINWTTKNSFSYPFRDVCFINKNIGFTCGGGSGSHGIAWGNMFVSEDGGQNWQEGQNRPGGAITKCVFIDSLNGFSIVNRILSPFIF